MIRGFFVMLWGLIQGIRFKLVVVLSLGLPIFLYLVFCADSPVFDPELDVDLGRRAAAAIEADPEQYPILPRDQNPEAYVLIQGIVDEILESPKIQYRDLFAYDRVKIIDADILNAFCTPGGFIYVYAGLIRYVDAEDHIAGVLGHEIAHAEMRHSSTRLQRTFGAERLAEYAILSQPITVANVVAVKILKELLTLSYSREQEAESDALSVAYLSATGHACDGAAGFFEKVIRQGDNVAIPAFLSDHPDSLSRVRDIKQSALDRGCSTELGDQRSWRKLQASLAANATESGSGT